MRARGDARADSFGIGEGATPSTSVTGQGLRYELTTSGLVLTLVDPRGSGLWRLSRTPDSIALSTVAGVGPELLRCGYIIDLCGVEIAVALGHRQHGYLPEVVRFTTRGIRWRQELTVDPLLVADDLWVAEATGAFDAVSVEGHGSAQTTGLDGQFR